MKKNLNLLKSLAVIIAFLLLNLFSTQAQNGPACDNYNNVAATIPTGLSGVIVYGIYVEGSMVYAATNSGLSISTNGGSSFTAVNDLNYQTVNDVSVSGSTVYAATNNGLYISTDGGATFTFKFPASVYGVYASGSTVYAATNDGLRISTDGGATFTKKNTTNGLGNDEVRGVYASGSTVYAATMGGVSISTNGGSSFTNKTTSNGLGNNMVRDVYASGSTIYAATVGGLCISTNGGTSFTNKTTINGLGANFVYGVYVSGTTVYAATESGLSISTDGGTSFTNYTTANGLGSNDVNEVYASGSTVYAATSGGLSTSTDGGATFVNKTSTIPSGSGLGSDNVGGVFANGNVVYAATSGGLSISTNGGSTFTNKTTTNGLGNNFVNGVYASGSTVYAATGGGLSISTDGGASFTNKTSTNGLGYDYVKGVFAVGSTIYAATYGGLSISTDGGASFTNRTTTNGLASNYVFGVCVSGSSVYAAVYGGLSISTDGGVSFTNKTTTNGLGDDNVTGVYASGSTVYAATSGGLSISMDGGTSFTNYTTANGLGDDNVTGVYASGSTVYAATGAGLSISMDGGTSFTNYTTANGLGSNNVSGVYASGNTVFVATIGGISSCSSISCTPTTSTQTVSACGSYVWNGTTYTASNNTATWVTTNAGGCDSTVTLNLTVTQQPAMPTLACYQTASFNSSTCSWDVTGTPPATPSVNVVNNCNGTSTLSTTATGTLLWSTTETASPITVSNAGTYTVTQTLNGCVSAAGSVVAAPKTTNTGDTTASACGSFVWFGVSYNASTTATHTFTNVNGCDSVVTLHLTINALPLSPTATLVQPNCNAGGTISVSNVLSGSSYSIDGFNYSSTGAFSDLAPGTYSITAKNAAGCISGATTVTLNEPTGVPPSATLSVTHPSCASAYGTIRVTSTVFFNSFSIDRTNFSNLTGVFSGLPAGTYNVWVKNAAGCISAPSTVVVNPQPATPAAPKVSITQPTCSVSTGTIEISSNLGDILYYSTNSFTYLNITGVFTGMVSGSYNVTSKNAAGCISPATPVVINARLTIPTTPSAVVTQPTCALSTGNITVSSPSATYTYSISRSGQTIGSPNGFFSGVASGTYSLIAISNAGCGSSAKSVVVNAPPAIPSAPVLSVTQPTTSVATGTIRVTSTVMGNSFSINGSGFTNLTGVFSGLVPNTYSITAKSSAGCISSPSTVTIGSTTIARGTETPAPVVASVLPIVPSAMASDLFEVGAYPNPSNTDFKLSINSASSETIRVTVYDVFGRAVKYFSFASKPFITLGQDLKTGIYMVELRQGKNVKSLKLVKF